MEVDELGVLHKVGAFLDKEFPDLCKDEDLETELIQSIYANIIDAYAELDALAEAEPPKA